MDGVCWRDWLTHIIVRIWFVELDEERSALGTTSSG